jgi:hypothetical protein
MQGKLEIVVNCRGEEPNWNCDLRKKHFFETAVAAAGGDILTSVFRFKTRYLINIELVKISTKDLNRHLCLC